MKKKIILGAFFLALWIPNLALAHSDIQIWMGGKILHSDVAPFVYQERTMVPVRVISENLGKKVSWKQSEQKVTIKDDEGHSFSLVLNEKVMADLSQESPRKIQLDVPAMARNNRTFVPLRAIAEAFGERVTWDQDNKIVAIGKGYDANKVAKPADPLGLDYLYNKEMVGKSDPEKAAYEHQMRKMPSKVFPGWKNGDIEACLAWLSYAKAGKFYSPGLNKNPLLNPKKNGLGFSPTEAGSPMSGYDDYEKEEYYSRQLMGAASGPSMADLEHFDYSLNFDGSFNSFRLPLHYHDTAPGMIKSIKEIMSKPQKVQFIKVDKKDIERLLATTDGKSYDAEF